MNIEFGADQKSHCRREPSVGLQHLRRLLFNHKGAAKRKRNPRILEMIFDNNDYESIHG